MAAPAVVANAGSGQGARRHRALVRMSHSCSVVMPSSAAMTVSGSAAVACGPVELRTEARRQEPHQLRADRLESVHMASSGPSASAPAFTATRHELAVSSSAFTHWATTLRIYVSYSFEVGAGNRSMRALSAPRSGPPRPSNTTVSFFRVTTTGPGAATGDGADRGLSLGHLGLPCPPRRPAARRFQAAPRGRFLPFEQCFCAVCGRRAPGSSDP